MKIIAVIIASYIVIGYFGVVPLRNEKKKKEMTIYISIMIFSLGLSIFLGLGIKYESIASIITRLVSLFIDV